MGQSAGEERPLLKRGMGRSRPEKLENEGALKFILLHFFAPITDFGEDIIDKGLVLKNFLKSVAFKVLASDHLLLRCFLPFSFLEKGDFFVSSVC